MKILVVKRDKIGDMLLTTPLLRLLKQNLSSAEIHVLANDYNSWVLEGNADIDHLWVYQRVKSGGKTNIWFALKEAFLTIRLRLKNFDFVLVGNGDVSRRAIKKSLRIGGRRIVAYCDESVTCDGVTEPLVRDALSHEVDSLCALAEPIGIRIPAVIPNPSYKLPVSADVFSDDWLTERGLRSGGYVVLGLGARRAKRQPSTKQVLDWAKFFKDVHGLSTVFMWTPGASTNPLYPGDDDIAQPVLDAAQEWIFPFRGQILPALGLIWKAKTSLFPDSGLMHFAAASPGGVLGFFAEPEISPPPEQWAPRGRNVDWLVAEKSVGELEDRVVHSRLTKLIQNGR